jgi:hypothetical protein
MGPPPSKKWGIGLHNLKEPVRDSTLESPGRKAALDFWLTP